MLDYKNVKILKTIRECESISRASKKLFTAQPNLSRSLKRIEENIGFVIFDRSKSPLALTQEGRILFDYIDKFQDLEKEMFKEINQAKSSNNSFIRIGSLTFMSQYIIPNIVPKLIEIYPNLELSLTKYDSTSFEDALLRDEIDLFITNRKITNKALRSVHVLNDKIYLMVSKSIYKNDKNSLEDYSKETFFLLNREKNLRKSVEDIFKVRNFYPENIKITSTIMNSVSLVRANKGVTFIYESALKMINSTSYCDFIKIDGDYAAITLVYKNPKMEEFAQKLSPIIKKYVSKKFIF
ncbi:LysR family transcriptional regulator [Peptoniphilus vaginalis]|uniref:LysR family transcriptional regulator n=1 Tax=Peptoniphilus vaginalis TaxID=1756987 RepID=UPI0023FA1AFB|nr:LysR family transcriptional regulator [Peptoniphilus vaginalis]